MNYRDLFITIIVLAFVDTPWLAFNSYVLKDPFYQGGGQLRLWAALVVYIALAYLLLQSTSAKDAFWTGVTVYAVYDFTLLTLFSKFSLTTALADTLWGGILFYISYMGVRFIKDELY
jgi:hypothetical protein